MLCCGKNNKIEEGLTLDTPKSPAKKLSTKSSESLAKDLKEYYRNSPERRHRVLVVNRKHFFNDSSDDDNK